ncbi:MAG: ribosomal-processing cysteine protease Prp [Ruminococcus sp.]|nr:ribosomal-processing cysteine protease Prp [Ruminococcus sp.]
MIRAEFFKSKGAFIGFKICGHAGYDVSGKDVVCAAVSSAVQLTMNLLNDLGFEPDVLISDNLIKCSVSRTSSASAIILEDLKQHFESILEEFPKTIKITISEV